MIGCAWEEKVYSGVGVIAMLYMLLGYMPRGGSTYDRWMLIASSLIFRAICSLRGRCFSQALMMMTTLWMIL